MLKVLLEIGPQIGLRGPLLMPKLARQSASVSESAEGEPALAADARRDARG